MTQQTKHIAVLTGDIVNSTALGEVELERAINTLERQSNTMAKWHDAPLHFTRHRGDGWQVALNRPERALRTALALRAAIRSLGKDYDTRVACAIRKTSQPLNANLNLETQEAFVASGRILEMITKGDDSARLVAEQGGALNAAFILADHISKDWTVPQAQAMVAYLTPESRPSLTAIAKIRNKSRQAVTKAIESAGGYALENALLSLEDKHPND